MNSIRVRQFLVTFFLACGTLGLTAQTLDTGILGTITDSSGAVVPSDRREAHYANGRGR
jgi:hypothetical protein